MARHVSAREARAHFAELTNRVHYTGEPVIVEKQGRPCAALVSMRDYEELCNPPPEYSAESPKPSGYLAPSCSAVLAFPSLNHI